MSLTSLLKSGDVGERFKQEFACPKEHRIQHKMLAPPLTNRYAVVGTAFDYLLRFYIKKNNTTAVTSPWVAEHAAELLDRMYSSWLERPESPFGIYLGSASSEAGTIITEAKQVYSDYLQNGDITDDLMKSALCLAQLDVAYRSKFRYLLETKLGEVWKRDIADLKKLISLVDMKLFKASKICLLNPTFGSASRLVGGADADVIIDDRLIDIKTTKFCRFERKYFHQIIGYYVLAQIGGIDGALPKPKITKLEIYFSRFGYLRSMNLNEIINGKTFPTFLKWFQRRAKEEQKQFN